MTHLNSSKSPFTNTRGNGVTEVTWWDLSAFWSWLIMLGILLAVGFVKTYLDKELPPVFFHYSCVVAGILLMIILGHSFFRLELTDYGLKKCNGVRLLPGILGKSLSAESISEARLEGVSDYSDFDSTEYKVVVITSAGTTMRIGRSFEKEHADFLCSLIKPIAKGSALGKSTGPRVIEILLWAVATVAFSLLIGISRHEDLDFPLSTNMKILGSLLGFAFFLFVFIKGRLPFREMEPSRLQLVIYILSSAMLFIGSMYWLYWI